MAGFTSQQAVLGSVREVPESFQSRHVDVQLQSSSGQSSPPLNASSACGEQLSSADVRGHAAYEAGTVYGLAFTNPLGVCGDKN
ncbi:hypothetical protein [Streptomyces sp. NPDC088358]|uniref:hypothetical protein n=1 Tax=Streptomyces sp. NPDC088358 TaxID=3365857 RepID=UPI0038087FBB